MESANSHHHHQLQDQLVGSFASSLATPSCYGVGFTTTHPWPPTSFLNSNSFSSYPSEIKQQENSSAVSSQLYSSMDRDTAFSWANNPPTYLTTNHQYDQDLPQHSMIKGEHADQYYRRYSEMLSWPQSSADELNLRNEQTDLQANDVATKFLLKSFPYGNLMNKIHFSPAASLYSNSTTAAANPREFAQILPSINVSSLNQTAVTSPGTLDINLEALDLLASSRFSGGFLTSSQNQIGILRDEFSNYGFEHMQESHQIPFYGSNKVPSASSSSVVESKRSSNNMAPVQNAPKKSRLEARSSCPPFKVRKEKLGDRIAALQQLVAPFGKLNMTCGRIVQTDTASVLMEAIGYMKFLQSQVETLSVPYMKASRNKPYRVIKGGSDEIENEGRKRDLKSRGLCLVPLSCLSYITDGGGAAVWPPPHFGGGT